MDSLAKELVSGSMEVKRRITEGKLRFRIAGGLNVVCLRDGQLRSDLTTVLEEHA